MKVHEVWQQQTTGIEILLIAMVTYRMIVRGMKLKHEPMNLREGLSLVAPWKVRKSGLAILMASCEL